MAAPINLEDLAKLKTFVEFVAANPTILNMPQLDFFKKLIEQFGGTVPEGTFQMPAGAKCPFGGDVKSENKSTSPPTAAEEDEEEISEMEAESEESDVELDMGEQDSQQLLQPMYHLKYQLPNIVEKPKLRKRKKSTRTCSMKNTNSKTQHCKKSFENIQLQIKEENEYEQLEVVEQVNNDSLLTTQVEIKCELNTGKIENDTEYEEYTNFQNYIHTDDDKDFCLKQNEDYESRDRDFDEIKEEFDDDGDGDEDYDCEEDYDNDEYDYEDEDDDGDEDDESDEDNEPLVLLTKTSAKNPYKKEKRTCRLINCRETCKHKCTRKYGEQQRIDIFNYYWHLSEDDKVNFIRKHIRKQVTRHFRSRFRNNCCYFLKHYKIGQIESHSCTSDGNEDLTKVCLKFFESTLRVSTREIKAAIEGYNLQAENIVRPSRKTIGEQKIKLVDKSENKIQQPQQFLDPETDTLSNPKPKTKTKRAKPEEPYLEHFPQPINCAVRCKFKCHQNFTETERKQICDAFWSMDFKTRKEYVLSRMQTSDVKSPTTPEYRITDRPSPAYRTKFFLQTSLKSENKRVCQHFFLNTLHTNRWFIENGIEVADKMTGSYTGPDKPRTYYPPNKASDELRQTVRNHINSYTCWLPNKESQTKYLHYDLSINKMFLAYKNKCLIDQQKQFSQKFYYKVFHEDFQLLFLKNPNPRKGGGFLLNNPHISSYTGEEAGGFWINEKDDEHQE